MVFWRAQEGVRQSPRTTEASNSFKIFNIHHVVKVKLLNKTRWQCVLLLYMFLSFPQFHRTMDRWTQRIQVGDVIFKIPVNMIANINLI